METYTAHQGVSLTLQETGLKCPLRSNSKSSFHFQEFEKFPCLASTTVSHFEVIAEGFFCTNTIL